VGHVAKEFCDSKYCQKFSTETNTDHNIKLHQV
jgi:hypothetical protein